VDSLEVSPLSGGGVREDCGGVCTISVNEAIASHRENEELAECHLGC